MLNILDMLKFVFTNVLLNFFAWKYFMSTNYNMEYDYGKLDLQYDVGLFYDLLNGFYIQTYEDV